MGDTYSHVNEFEGRALTDEAHKDGVYLVV